MNFPISRLTAPHYTWAEVCDGWRLVDDAGLSVIEERVPPGATEVEHHHERARQFFYVLSGEATLLVGGVAHRLMPRSGLEIPPGARHQFRNDGTEDVVFLVISAPSTRGDRVHAAGPAR
jgi:mannose-6-phosphate isomerase-like protein (cupin superfamily)